MFQAGTLPLNIYVDKQFHTRRWINFQKTQGVTQVSGDNATYLSREYGEDFQECITEVIHQQDRV
jgi:hypothetical protein